jgi:hypothetical protein
LISWRQYGVCGRIVGTGVRLLYEQALRLHLDENGIVRAGLARWTLAPLIVDMKHLC